MSEFVQDPALVEWVRSALPYETNVQQLARIDLAPLVQAGGLCAHMIRVVVKFEDDEHQDKNKVYVLKSSPESSLQFSKSMGIAREALFYNEYAATLRTLGLTTPVVLRAEGDLSIGSYRMLMEDLSKDAVQSGYYFGSGSPLNWQKDLPTILSTFADSTGASTATTFVEVARDTFLQMARMHRHYWRDARLITDPSLHFLRGHDQFGDAPTGFDVWMGQQKLCIDRWAGVKAKVAAGNTQVKWHPLVVECVDAAIALNSWETFLEERRTRPWTLIHGDCHPANIMWHREGRAIFLDWAMVGIGSGAKELAQYMISHVSPSDRRLHEETLLREYHAELTRVVPGHEQHPELATYTLEDCRRDYVIGGAQRWCWGVAVFDAICPEPMTQYFQDQLGAFLEDHGVSAAAMTLPYY